MDIENDSCMNTIHEVWKNLYVGGILAAHNPSNITKYNIKSIVQVLGTIENRTYHANINYHIINLDDLPNSNIIQYVPEAITFIDNELTNGRPVLIHCAAGVSRSVSIAIAYLVVKNSQSFEDTLSVVRNSRRWACPNPGFEAQLKAMNVLYMKNYLANTSDTI